MIKSTFRLPKELHRRLKIRAVEMDRPLGELLIEALEIYLNRDRGTHGQS